MKGHFYLFIYFLFLVQNGGFIKAQDRTHGQKELLPRSFLF